MVVHTHLKAVVGLLALQEEVVVQLRIHIAWTTLRISCSEIRAVQPWNAVVTRLTSSNDMNHTIGGGHILRTGIVRTRQRQTDGIVQTSREQTVYADTTIMGQCQVLVDILVIRPVLNGIRVLTVPVLGIHIAQLGIRMPFLGDVDTIAYAHGVAVKRLRLHTGVAPRLGIVHVEVQHTVFIHPQTLAQRIVHHARVNLTLHLPGGHTNLRFHHHESAC